MKSELEIQQLIQLEAPMHNCILLRNNSGAMKDVNGRVVRYGLGNQSKNINENFKSSDLIGVTSVVITPDMIGQKVAIFTAVEVKRKDWKPSQSDKRQIAQQNFIDFIKSKGGIAGFVNSIDTFKKLLGK